MIAFVDSVLRQFVPSEYHAQLKLRFVALIRPLLKQLYKGSKYQCPFCNSKLRSMLSRGSNVNVSIGEQVIGGGWRQNAVCPCCLSTDRERLVYLYLLLKTKVLNSKDIDLLHVAPERKLRKVLALNTGINYLSADLNPRSVDMRMNITEIQFTDNSFDVIVCNHVLEHVLEDVKAMAELFRVLKHGGFAILQVPLSLKLDSTYEDINIREAKGRKKAFGQKDHIRIYALRDYKKRLESVGFQVSEFQWCDDDAFDPVSNRYGLNTGEPVIRVDKP